MRLENSVVVVAGGTGVVGETVVNELLARGARVAVPSRSPDRAAALRSAHPSERLLTVPGGMDSQSAAASALDAIAAKFGPIDGVVATLGGWWEGPALTALDETTWRELMDTNLTSHFIAVRTFVPVLADRPGSVYLTTNGVGATMALPNAGPISVSGAAQRRLIEVLAAQLADRPVRLHELSLMTPVVTRHWDPREPRKPSWLEGAVVGMHIADLLDERTGADAPLLVSLGTDTD